jgi:hypothetical protein
MKAIVTRLENYYAVPQEKNLLGGEFDVLVSPFIRLCSRGTIRLTEEPHGGTVRRSSAGGMFQSTKYETRGTINS